MKLREIIKDSGVIQVRGNEDLEITHICSDSRKVVPGSLFIAVKGHDLDGQAFIGSALKAGAVAVALGSAVGAGCFVLAFGGSLFWPAAGLLLVLLLMAVTSGVRTYRRSLRHTEAHRRYLLANGATRLESVIPSVRRALRSAVLPLALHRTSSMLLVLPVLFFALLLGGFSLAGAMVALLLLWLLALAVGVLATVLALWLSGSLETALAKRSSRRL